MAFTVVALTCPACGANVSDDNNSCEYCGSKLIFSEFNDIYSMSGQNAEKYLNFYTSSENREPEASFSAGMCCLKLRLYEKAYGFFDSAISANFNNSKAYFFASVSLLNGKKAFLSNRGTIAKITELIKAALAIEPCGIYHYFWGYIQYDYYERKCLNVSPDFRECLEKAEKNGVTEQDKKMLFDILGVEKPSNF